MPIVVTSSSCSTVIPLSYENSHRYSAPPRMPIWIERTYCPKGADAPAPPPPRRPEPRPGPIGDAEIHRHAAERAGEPPAVGLRQRFGSKRRTEEGRGARDRPLAALGIGEHRRRDR